MTDKLKNIVNKVRSHSHTASFLIAIAVMTFFCSASRITPFGDNTFLYDDMRREYIRYYAHLSSALHGQGSMIYSSEKGLGGSMLGLYVSYISSPLNLIYALFPVKYYPEVLTFLTILRFGLMSLTADIFLRYIGLKKTIPFALSFGLSLYVFTTLINPEWMDLLIFFPLFMISAIRLSKDPGSTRAFITHTLVTAAMLFINYYLSYMVLIFLALFMIIRTFLRKISPYALFRVFISTVAGILLVMPILLPVLRELMLSEKDIGDTSLLQRLADHFILTDPLKVFSRLFTLSLDERQLMFGMPHLFCGMVIIPLAILFFIYKEIPLKDKIESLILMMILSASFCIRSLDLLWHVGNDPNGYYERYAFLFTSIMVVCAARAWNTGVIRIKSLTAAFSVTAFFMLLVYFRSESLGISWYSGKKMAAGMILLALEYLLILLMTGVAGATDKTGGTGRMGFRVRAAAAGVLMVLCMADLLWNQHVLMASAVIPSEPDSQYRAELSAKSALVDSIKEKDDYFFYRIEDTYSDTYDCLNDSMVYRYNGLSHYSTGDHLSVRMFLKAAGFNYNGLMDVYNPENTDTCDSFLDIKYLLTSKGVYTNENVFPAAVKTTGEVPSDIIMDSPFEFQKQIASAFSGLYTSIRPL